MLAPFMINTANPSEKPCRAEMPNQSGTTKDAVPRFCLVTVWKMATASIAGEQMDREKPRSGGQLTGKEREKKNKCKLFSQPSGTTVWRLGME